MTNDTDMIQLLLNKYGRAFPTHNPLGHVSSGEVVLLTGSTGSFGCYILASLLTEPAQPLKRVYCLNRKDATGARSLHERQRTAFQQRDLDSDLLDSDRVIMLEADTTLPHFDLELTVFDTLTNNVTCVIHNAWKLDFVPLSEMEPLVAGTRNLIDFCLGSPFDTLPRFLFVSTNGVAINWNENAPLPETAPLMADMALGNGYGESKWVSEQIVIKAVEVTGLNATIVRPGQLFGGPTGTWPNLSEWFPPLVKSAVALKCLPATIGTISWIPTHVAASALVEMRQSSYRVLHLAHPTPFSSSIIFNALSSKLRVPLVSYAQWLSTLEKEAGKPDATIRVPAAKLLNLWRRGADHAFDNINDVTHPSKQSFGLPTLDMQLAIQAAPSSLQNGNLPHLTHEDVKLWVTYWRRIGYLAA